ncbi:acyl-CoA dehydrogenase [Thermoplasma volcanium GSS1]|uniref:Acyl-CoA dehydrogenase n=1 Tax=Thermoplasma volcanium (strain ATCC 51530 / DSM 4299 / JCM 9571 / NBRC 15438 / GSS1) TaxID=273116 RepID=Q979L6_THEVO|nr:acyl-CoA dehydrogenase [Thermoplasma volcanium]BAB60286.1 acyl-CoA dehydrogenase [Thermoplasma volcanium GSS1]
MANFGVSPEEEMVLTYVKKFAQEELKPRAKEIDAKMEVPREIIDRMKQLGFFATYIPKEYGGLGMSFPFLIRAIEEISKACPSTALVLDGALTLFAEPIIMFGSEDLKKRYLTRVASGSVGGLAITEPGAGSDAAGISTTAEKRGDKYIINGDKIFISNGRISDFFVFDAVTDPGKRHKGITAFVVDANTPGLKISRDIHKMGIRGSSTVELVFEDMEVPAENIVGELNGGFKVIMETLDAGRIGIAAQALGIAEEAFAEAMDYIKQRKQFGTTISSFEGIQFMIADMATEIEAARYLTYVAAEKWQHKEDTIEISAMAKLKASDVAVRVTTDALQLFGGYGYTVDLDAERHMRDSKITQIYEGTNQIQRLVIAKELLKKTNYY